MVEITQDRWASLREQRHTHEDIYEQVAEDLGVELIGVSKEGRLHLLLAIEVAPQNLPPDLQSLQVRILEGGQIWLDVSASSHHEELLTLVANKILHAIHIEGRDPAISVARIIDDMRAALRPLAPDLSAAEQIGLFGELWVLSNVLLPTIGPRVSHLWSGPESERHDFVGQGVHVEVKTTTRSEPKHEISRFDQLKAPQQAPSVC
ncbi:PD-(D/E)XK motif protein [Pseudomonas shirazica]|nr:PD-(D/E)XK motif protein [Pseudomonas shirazica]